jgi:RNA polymerase sigma factor (TIGR02999 family)
LRDRAGERIVTSPENPVSAAQSDGKTLRDWIPDIYDKAYDRAHRMLSRWWGIEKPDTASLVDRAVCKLLECSESRCESRQHALNILAQTMRWVLIDILKAIGSRTARDGEPESEHRAARPHTISLDVIPEPSQTDAESFVSLNEALERLNAVSPRLRQVIELRRLVGLTIEETARAMDMSTTTVTNDTRLAEAWLLSELAGPHPRSPRAG